MATIQTVDTIDKIYYVYIIYGATSQITLGPLFVATPERERPPCFS